MNARTCHRPTTKRHALALLGVLLAATPARARADEDSNAAANARVRRVVVGKEYGASGKYRLLWGGDYRRLWSEPIQVKVLDLQTFAGGLTP